MTRLHDDELGEVARRIHYLPRPEGQSTEVSDFVLTSDRGVFGNQWCGDKDIQNAFFSAVRLFLEVVLQKKVALRKDRDRLLELMLMIWKRDKWTEMGVNRVMWYAQEQESFSPEDYEEVMMHGTEFRGLCLCHVVVKKEQKAWFDTMLHTLDVCLFRSGSRKMLTDRVTQDKAGARLWRLLYRKLGGYGRVKVSTVILSDWEGLIEESWEVTEVEVLSVKRTIYDFVDGVWRGKERERLIWEVGVRSKKKLEERKRKEKVKRKEERKKERIKERARRKKVRQRLREGEKGVSERRKRKRKRAQGE